MKDISFDDIYREHILTGVWNKFLWHNNIEKPFCKKGFVIILVVEMLVWGFYFKMIAK